MNHKFLTNLFQTTSRAICLRPALLNQTRFYSTTEQDDMAQLEKRIQEEYDTYAIKVNEPVEKKRARLLWQSRKRGIAENCLLFGTFSQKYLDSLTEEQLVTYDRILNDYVNEWDLYYWMVGTKEVPKVYQSDIMTMLQQHCRNEERETRFKQPDLPTK